MSPRGLLPPVRPSGDLAAAYRRRLERLIDAMSRSVAHWVSAAYRGNEPRLALLAADELPAVALERVLRRLTRHWSRRFDDLARDLARWFATAVHRRSDATLRSYLKRSGLAVEFRMTDAMRDAYRATIAENVGLIRSIPARFLTDVQGQVMRSVQTGRDLATLTDELKKSYGVAHRRAALISRDQNNKAHATMTRTRYLALGIEEAVWVHSGGGKVPRLSHVKAGRDRVVYKVAEGWYDPHERKHVHPGELINCRCVCRPVLPTAVKKEAA